MAKRSTSTSNTNPTKRVQRTRGHFRRARPPSEELASSSQTSVFITLAHHDSQDPRAPVKAQHTRILTNTTPEASAPLSTDVTRSNTPDPLTQPIQPGKTHPIQGDPPVEDIPKTKRHRQTKNVDRLTEWLQYRTVFLDEILRHDGLADFLGRSECSRCGKQDGIIKCRDCSSGPLLKCSQCIIETHEYLPLHRIEKCQTQKWTGTFFDKISLCDLGLRYQLGHSAGTCSVPLPGPKGFSVLDNSGLHYLNIDYCNCRLNSLPAYIQLLREKWFPATFIRPHTVITFDCLETFHELTLQGKTNVYDYYNTLLRRYDNAAILKQVNRYTEIHRVFRMWRNLMAFKRAGRGHEPNGIANTPKGGLMVECPACPHLGKNLPSNWMNAGPLLFLYTLFVAVDANFKLRGKERHLKDVELMYGLGAYVEEDAYQTHISNYVEQPEINTCESQHDALVRAATRSSPGYSISGAVVVICTRHCMIRKNGAGDLQKGEKYCNVDFVIFSALMGIAVLYVVLTYDIGCQWCKKYPTRMEEFPPEMHIPAATKLEVAIPGWHINGHGDKCRNGFNLAYIQGVGRTVGEEIETTWAGTNPLAPSVREMAPAVRHDTLNDHWNGWNFRKIVGFRKLFLKRFHEAWKMSIKQAEAFEQMSSTFPTQTVQKWEQMVETWNANPKAPNPYAEPKNSATMNDVRLVLAQEEAADLVRGEVPRHKMSKSAFLIKGFELEDSQYLLRRDFAATKGLRTSKQLADFQERRNALSRLIHNWREVQLHYMPHVASLISTVQNITQHEYNLDNPSVAQQPAVLAENIPLYLPSGLPHHIRELPELSSMCKLELRLRNPQANDALESVRRQRRVVQSLWQFKQLNTSGTGNKPNTKMVTLYKRFDSKTKRAVNEYRTAWRALRILDPSGSWISRLKELKDEDIRGPGRQENDPLSTSRFEPSWIWLVPRDSKFTDSSTQDQGDTADEFHDCMRVEWAKAKARTARWKEELLLVQEEMRRVIDYLRWKSLWWIEQASRREDADTSILSGISGYSYKQATMCRRIASQCAHEWLPRLKLKGINPEWSIYYTEHTHIPRARSHGENNTHRLQDDSDTDSDDDEDEDDIDENGTDMEDDLFIDLDD